MKRIDRLSYLQRITSLLGKGEVIVLTGHRRAGKSCILESLESLLAENGNVLFLDMENRRSLKLPWHIDDMLTEDGADTIQKEWYISNPM